MATIVFLTTLASLLLTGVDCLQWSADLKDGATVYVCEEQNLTLPWKFTTDAGEQIKDIEWLFRGSSSQMIAMYSHDSFLPSPSYSQRVMHVPNGGLVLKYVSASGDEGYYTIEVSVVGGPNGFSTHNHTVAVHVATLTSARTDATMEVRQTPRAIYDNPTGQYHVELTCNSRGREPPAVLWTNPAQQHLHSSSKESGVFSLLLSNPVSSGNYTCRIPPDSPAATCLPRNDPALEGDTVYVDEIKARMTLMEAEQTALRLENVDLKQRVQTLEISRRVIFHAALEFPVSLSTGSHLIPNIVTINLGNAYNPSTGEFTVPYAGVYFFTATAGADTFGVDHFATLHIAVDNRYHVADRVYNPSIYTKSVNYYEQGTLSYAIHLTRGQRVWLIVNNKNSVFGQGYTTFTGFLLKAD